MAKQRNSERLTEAKAELIEVDAAITAILSGAQSYRIGTRSLNRADLATLYKRKDMLKDLIATLSSGGRRRWRIIPIG